MKIVTFACALTCSALLTTPVLAYSKASPEQWAASFWTLVTMNLSTTDRNQSAPHKKGKEVYGIPSGEACEICSSNGKP